MEASQIHALVKQLIDVRRYREAEQEARNGLSLYPDEPTMHDVLALAVYCQNRLDEALHHLRLAANLDPNNYYYHQFTAKILLELRRFDEGISTIQVAIRLQPNSASGYGILANLLMQEFRLEEALVAINKAIQLDAMQEWLFTSKGRCLYLMMRYDEAEPEFAEAIRLNPEDPESHRMMGLLYSETGRKEAALGKFHQTLRLDPFHAFAKESLIYTHVSGNAFYRALRLPEKLFTKHTSGRAILSGWITLFLLPRFALEIAERIPSLEAWFNALAAVLIVYAFLVTFASTDLVFSLSLLNSEARRAMSSQQRYTAILFAVFVSLSVTTTLLWIITQEVLFFALTILIPITYILCRFLVLASKDSNFRKQWRFSLFIAVVFGILIFAWIELVVGLYVIFVLPPLLNAVINRNPPTYIAADAGDAAVSAAPSQHPVLQEHSRQLPNVWELRERIANDPQDVQTLRELAEYYLSVRRIDEAMQIMATAFKNVSNDPENFYLMACILHAQSSDDPAMKNLEQAIRLNPTEVKYHTLLSQIYLDNRQFDKALTLIDNALASRPDNNELKAQKEVVLTQFARTGYRSDFIQQIIQQNPDSATSYMLTGWLHLWSHESTEAVESFRKALQRDPKRLGARHGMIEALKANSLWYRFILGFLHHIRTLQAKPRLFLVIGMMILLFILVEPIRYEPLEVSLPFSGIAFLVLTLYLSWLAGKLSNVVLRFSPNGRYTLTQEQVQTVGIILFFLALGLGCSILAITYESRDWAITSVLAFLALFLFASEGETHA